jgi:hypothetical protein
MRRTAVLLAIVGSALVAACGVTTDPDDRNTTFQVEPITPPDTAHTRATAQGGNNTYIVTGVILTPNDCQFLRRNVDVSGTTITVQVTAFATITICGTTKGAYNYRIVAGSVPEGTYTLRVVHQSGAGRETVLETQVTIT